MSAAARRIGGLAAGILLTLTLQACVDDQDELQQWMEQQKREV